jgi:gliding motility-associated-like protein
VCNCDSVTVTDLKKYSFAFFVVFSVIFSVNGQNLVDCWHVKSNDKISETKGGFSSNLDLNSRFGTSVSSIGDLDGDGVIDLAVGNAYDNFAGSQAGAFWVIFMNSNGTVKSEVKITNGLGGFTGNITTWDNFGFRVAGIGDLDGDGVEDIAVSSEWRHTGAIDGGSIWICFMNTNGTVKSQIEIGENLSGFTGTIDDEDLFGLGLGNIGDINGDGIDDIAVGAGRDDDGGLNSGAVYILFMNTNGTVQGHQKISSISGGLTGLPIGTQFGTSVDGIGDLNNDGVNDIIVGAPLDDDGGPNRGALYVLYLNANGTVSSQQKISDTQGNFGYSLDNEDMFGWTVASGFDIDGDGIWDVTSGSEGGDDAGPNRGEGYVLFMNANGTVREYLAISQLQGNFNTVLDDGDLFGRASSIIGDLDGDGFIDVVFGADADDNGGVDQGGIYIIHLDTTPPVLTATSDTTICDSVPVKLFVSGAQTYLWNNGNLLDDSTSSQPTLTTTSAVLMEVFGTDAFGCVGMEQVLVNFNLDSNIFPIDSGLCQGQYLSAFLPGALSYIWNTGDTSSAIPINSEGFYAVTVSLPDNCISNGEVNILFTNPKVDLGPDTIICIGDVATLEAWPNDSLSILWSTGSTTRVIQVGDIGTYWTQVGDSNCIGSDTVVVAQYEKLFIEWDDTVQKCLDVSLILEGNIPLATYLWQESIEAPLFQINDTGIYTVQVSNLCETIRDTISVVGANCECTVFVPNAFTPNGDNRNDVFQPIINCEYSTYHLWIFDRWGVMVFETTDQDAGWDGYVNGELAAQGMYVWRIEKSFVGTLGVESSLGSLVLIQR